MCWGRQSIDAFETQLRFGDVHRSMIQATDVSVFESKGGMIRLETLIELELSIRVFRAYPLMEIRQMVPCRAIRGDSISVNSTLPPSY